MQNQNPDIQRLMPGAEGNPFEEQKKSTFTPDGKKKDHGFSGSLGVSTNGFNVSTTYQGLFNRLEHLRDSSTLGFNRSNESKSSDYRYFFNHKHPFIKTWGKPDSLTNPIREVPMTWAIGHEIDTKRTKLDSREHTTTLELSENESAYTYKLINSIRRNSVAMGSLGFMKYEAMPTIKQSASVEYSDHDVNYMRKANIEAAIPASLTLNNVDSPQFIKLEVKN